jgi:hypothetical protein
MSAGVTTEAPECLSAAPSTPAILLTIRARCSLPAMCSSPSARISHLPAPDWIRTGGRLDDVGHTGTNRDGPALERLLHLVFQTAVQKATAYRHDRLTRRPGDGIDILAALHEHDSALDCWRLSEELQGLSEAEEDDAPAGKP